MQFTEVEYNQVQNTAFQDASRVLDLLMLCVLKNTYRYHVVTIPKEDQKIGNLEYVLKRQVSFGHIRNSFKLSQNWIGIYIKRNKIQNFNK